MEKLFKGLASEPRRAILTHLLEGPMTVGEIGNHFDMALPSISKHLAILKEAGIVTERKRGQYVIHMMDTEALSAGLLAFLAPFDERAAALIAERGTKRRRG